MRFVRFVPLASLAALASLSASVSGCRSLGGPGAGGSGAAEGTLAPGAMGGPRSRVASRLPNGVTVLVEENHAAPVVAIQVWVAGGAAADPAGLSGAAHLYEHLLFAGTRRRPAGAAERDIDALGGRLGAWTGLDETVFHATLAAPFFEQGLDVLADALTGPTFPAAAVEEAKRAALAELARQAADPSQQAADQVRAALFAGGGYGRAVLGTPASVAAITRDALASRFAECYVGAAMTVVVVGDVQSGAAKAAVARAFASVPSGSLGSVDPGGTGPVAPPAVALAGSSPDGALALGVRVTSADPTESAALDLMAALLTRGEESRLTRELADNRQVATAVHGFTFRARDRALLQLVLTPSPQRSEAAAQALLDETLRLAREEVPADELARARALLLADLAHGEEGADGHARRLGWERAVLGRDGASERYRARLEKLDPAGLRAAAARLLRADAMALAVVEPARARAGLDAESGRLSALLAAATAAPPPVAEKGPATPAGDLVRVTTPAGVRVVVLRDPGAPSVVVEAAWAGGGRAEDAGSNGAAALIAALLDRGTRARSAAQIAGDMRNLGGSLSGIADRHHLGLRAELLPATWRRGLAILADCLLRPSFPAGELDGGRRVVIDRARAGDGDPARAAWKLFREALWADQPFRLEPAGTPASLASLTRVRLLDHYRRHYPLDRLVLVVVGDVDPRDAAAAVAAAFVDRGARPVSSPPPPLAIASSRRDPITLFGATDRDRAEIVLGYPAAPVGDADRPALEVLAEVLEARGTRSVAPGTVPFGAMAARGFDPGYLALTATSRPDDVDATVARLRAAVAELLASGVTAEETARAAQRLAGRRALELRSRAAIADAVALDEAFGLPPLTYRSGPDRLARVTAADLARAARRWLDPQHEAIAVVRPDPPRAQAVAGATHGERESR